MARISQNPITSDLQGAVGKSIVFRRRNGKTYASKYPDMSRVKLSPDQKKENDRFSKAVAYARSINNNPAKKAAFKVKKKGQSVYHAAIQQYLLKQK